MFVSMGDRSAAVSLSRCIRREQMSLIAATEQHYKIEMDDHRRTYSARCLRALGGPRSRIHQLRWSRSMTQNSEVLWHPMMLLFTNDSIRWGGSAMFEIIRKIHVAKNLREHFLTLTLCFMCSLFLVSLFKNIYYPLLWADESMTVMYGERVLR